MHRFLAAFLLVPGVIPGAREPLIFDTDSGLFGDDGGALVMLLRSQERVSVEAITLVPGNVWPDQGAAYMNHILDLVKRPDVPIYKGAGLPLVHTPAMAKEAERRWGKVEYTGAFAQDPTLVKPPPGAKLSTRGARSEAAALRIASAIAAHPGEVTILALGPLTNIAIALRLRPEIETRIRQIVWMGGNVAVSGNATPKAEFNFWFDPEAARIVLRSRIPRKVMFGLDICNRAVIRNAEFQQIVAAGTPVTDLYREDYGNRYPGFLKNPGATGFLWDELAAAYLLDPGFVTRSEKQYLDVETAWGDSYGATIPLDRSIAPEATPVEVMFELDFPRVFALYKGLLTRKD